MLDKAKRDHLIGKFGRENVYTEKEDLLVLGYDATPELHHIPEVVVYPRSVEEVVFAVDFCRQEGVPLVARGSATGLSGGSAPTRGGMVLCLTRMNRIIEVDRENLTATVEAGVITLDLFNAAMAQGLFYPPDPGSQTISTLGGNVAENAGGLRGLKYGVTRDYVMGLTAVLPDGTVLKAGNKCVKDVAGYSLRDLMVGSEGTLGIITEVTVKLINPPQAKKTFLAQFRDMRTAGEAVSKIIAARIIPATMEIMDQTTINCIEDFKPSGLPRDMAALLLVEVDGHPAVVAEEAAGVRRVLEAVGAASISEARDAVEAENMANARRAALPSVARVSPTIILEDATVPRSHLAEIFAEVERLKTKYNITVATYGHAGDGNLHPSALTDERNREEVGRVHAFFGELYDKALALGGTVSGEHGIGLAKRDYLRRQIGAGGVAVMKRIKNAFDPTGFMNPDKMFRDGEAETARAGAAAEGGSHG